MLKVQPVSLWYSPLVVLTPLLRSEMSQFIAMHILFQTADPLLDLLSAMFPDSKIAASFSYKNEGYNL